MNYVYVLQSLKDKDLYIGMTEDVVRREKDHYAGKVESTRNRRPLKLIYYECYLDEDDAKGREKFLKSGSGHRFLKKQLNHFFDKQSRGCGISEVQP